jgi:hypothetical protein
MGAGWRVAAALAVTLVALLWLTLGTEHVDTLLGALTKLRMQRHVYAMARRRAKQTGKPLLVIGNPTGGFMNRFVQGYGCGDACVDLNGCECPHGGTSVKSDLLASLLRMRDDSVVSFESAVLGYVDDIRAVVAELRRVTGGDMFAVHLLGTRSGFPSGMDISPKDEVRMPHKRIVTHCPPFHHEYLWTETPQFASHLYFSRSGLAGAPCLSAP